MIETDVFEFEVTPKKINTELIFLYSIDESAKVVDYNFLNQSFHAFDLIYNYTIKSMNLHYHTTKNKYILVKQIGTNFIFN